MIIIISSRWILTMFNSLENCFKLFYIRDFCTLIFKKIPTVDRPPLGRFAPSSRTLDKCAPFEVLPLQNSVFRRACSWTFEVHSKIFWLYSECINNIRASSIGRPACLIFFYHAKNIRGAFKVELKLSNNIRSVFQLHALWRHLTGF